MFPTCTEQVFLRLYVSFISINEDKNALKCYFLQKKFKIIWSCQKIVVPLHPLLVERLDTRLAIRSKFDESVAQQVEHIPFKDGVLGSSPSWFTERRAHALLFLCYPITIFTILPGTTMIFLIALPARYLAVSSCARTSFSTSSFGVSFGHSNVKRTLPLN